ncbi:VaFE repeat-containing surface-anchored protein [Collinsella sp. zg1085]|uniref:SpaA isopeptide-forming pilin-related protein n=1 Tax=Collinsella sp. zg1085 TaxID=2844380 RepID=UPI001C0AE36C|nr:SpaA isopeptide-forming pilin-related protein [Collinsella sp. zg1085]QWT17268.1 VaFE repeat-containing surface-anchored protein [Collinsella sp. zg1085]
MKVPLPSTLRAQQRLLGFFYKSLIIALSFILATSTLLSSITPKLAFAESKQISVVDHIHNPYSSSDASAFFRTDKGVSYCAQGYLKGPQVGQKLDFYGNLGIPELDYVLYHGYDGKIVTSVAGLNAELSEVATALAVWLAIDTQRPDVLTFSGNTETYHGNRYARERWEKNPRAEVKQAAWQLYQAGLAYKEAGGGGLEAGTAQLWLNNTTNEHGVKPYQALLTANKKVEVSVKFSKVSAKASFTAGNSEYSLAGAEYDIYRASSNEKVAHIVTGSDGSASYKLLPNIDYYAIETKAPKGFKLNPEKHYFTAKQTSAAEELVDDPGHVLLSIRKKDSATLGMAQPGATLAGAEYTVIDANGETHTGITNDKGNLVIQDLPLGKIRITETKAPKGYKLDTAIHEFVVKNTQLNDAGIFELEPEDDFREDVKAFDIEIAKFKGVLEQKDDYDGAATPAQGVSFEIISNTTNKTVATITTNKNGFATTRTTDKPWYGAGMRNERIQGALPYDEHGYTVREVASTVPAGYKKVADWTISAAEQVDGALLQYIRDDAPLSSRIQIVKVDAESGNTVALAGFAFKVKREDGSYVVQTNHYPNTKKLDTFVTDESGMVTLPERLGSGTYTVEEVAAVKPYLLNTEPATFTVASREDAIKPLIMVKIKDHAAKGTIELTKLDSETRNALTGAEFDVVAAEAIKRPDGTVEAVQGQILDHLITNKQGRATSKELPLGSGYAHYQLKETKAPSGYVLKTTPIDVSLSYKDQTTKLVTTSVDATNTPSETKIKKLVKDTTDTLSGVSFGLWSASDEIGIHPEDAGTFAIRADHAQKLELSRVIDTATLAPVALNQDIRLTLQDEKGTSYEVGETEQILAPGTYKVFATREGHALSLKTDTLSVLAGHSYSLDLARHLFGMDVKVVDSPIKGARRVLHYNEQDDVYTATALTRGDYKLLADNKVIDTITLDDTRATFATLSKGKLEQVPVLLTSGTSVVEKTTDKNGFISYKRLAPSSYRITELSTRPGYVLDPRIHYVTVDEEGMTEGKAIHTITAENDYTKLDFSKRDIANEEALVGAKLEVLDEKGKLIESWTSTKEDHRINALPQGVYTLVERLTPKSYDEATQVSFEVKDTGEVQRVVMYDTPISITGTLDKRQEIADPIHPYTEANGDNNNTAKTKVSDTGDYSYTLDFRNTSNTWVDEFSVTDNLRAAEAGLATLTSITTPQASKDFNGKLNVWVKTNMDAPRATPANETLNDGHINPWLAHEANKVKLGSDGRALDYTNWQLLADGVDATRARELKLDALGLRADEKVVAIRFEFGRVEAGFTTRVGAWERENLKAQHDDIEDADALAQANGTKDGVVLRPAIIHMQVTDAYRAGIVLENQAQLDLYRNGGDEPGLEDHDEDEVAQTPKEATREIGTSFTDKDGKKTVRPGEKTELVDEVSYTGLEVGIEHTITGTIMDKATGKALLDKDGHEMVSTTTFTPEKVDGAAKVIFSIDTTNLNGHDLVAFEEMSIKVSDQDESGKERERVRIVAEHKDIHDMGQTVQVRDKALEQTGDALPLAALVITSIATGVASVLIHTRKKHLT